MNNHFPVMLNEIVSSLKIKPNGTYIDLTLGNGGHACSILKKLDTGKLFAFDKDINAIKEGGKNLKQVGSNFKLFHLDFRHFKNELANIGIKKVDGIIADLGVSSPQIDNPNRGFSYNKNGTLDMRMDQGQKLDAYKIVNFYSEEQLVEIFRYFADVKLPKRVAKGIIANRPIETTLELVQVIKKSLPAAIIRQKNPAKAIFQAIRIAVNDELNALKQMLEKSITLLNHGGSLAIITFHSLEDKIVKKSFQKFLEDPTKQLPIVFQKKYIAKIFFPSIEEINKNKRSRSAKLRVLTYL